MSCIYAVDDRFNFILSPGFRAVVVNEKELQSVVGLGLPVGLNRPAENYGVFLYLSIEHKLF